MGCRVGFHLGRGCPFLWQDIVFPLFILSNFCLNRTHNTLSHHHLLHPRVIFLTLFESASRLFSIILPV